MLVKFIRLRDAPYYLGMDVRLFNKIVRPYVLEFPIGKQGIGFDRCDLDAWAEDYKKCYGKVKQNKIALNKTSVNKKITTSASIRSSKATQDAFDKIVDQIYARKRKK